MKINATTSTTAKDIAAVCTTAAAAKNYYKDLTAAGLDKAAAREMVKAAAEMVKASNADKAAERAEIRADINTGRAWYRDSAKVLHAVFVGFVKSAAFKAATKGLQFSGNECAFVERFSPARLDNGRPVRVCAEFVNGVRFVRYRFIDTRRASSFTALLDNCLKGVRAARLGEFSQIVIPTKGRK